MVRSCRVAITWRIGVEDQDARADAGVGNDDRFGKMKSCYLDSKAAWYIEKMI